MNWTRISLGFSASCGTHIERMILRPLGDGRYEGEASFGGGATNPGQMDVRSNLGGTDTSEVRE